MCGLTSWGTCRSDPSARSGCRTPPSRLLFRVLGHEGREVFGGWTAPWSPRLDPSSGAAVHGIDYTRHQRTRHFARNLDPSFAPPPTSASRAARHRRTTRAGRPIRACLACRRSAAISTNRPRKRPTTYASAGTPRSSSWPRSSAHERIVSGGVSLRCLVGRVPDRGRRVGGRARRVDLGPLLPPTGRGRGRGHRRRGMRPLPPLARGPRADGRAWAGGLPLLDRLAARAAGRPRRLNRKGVDFYRRLATGLGERGIEPVVTLYHADLPAALQDRGGWAARDTAERFADYARAMADALGDVVAHWITHNEPWGVAFSGHADGVKAPGLRDWPTALQVAHHLLVSHGLAVEALRAARPDANVGISLNLAGAGPRPRRPPTSPPRAARTASSTAGSWTRCCAAPTRKTCSRGSAPRRRVRDPRRGHARRSRRRSTSSASTSTTPTGSEPAGRRPLRLEPAPAPPPHSPLGWQIDPQNLRDVLDRLASEYGRRPSGSPRTASPTTPRPRSSSGSRTTGAWPTSPPTSKRSAAHSPTASTSGGTSSGRCSTASSGSSATAAPFGLIHVDAATQERTPKRSAHWYRDFIAAPAPINAANDGASRWESRAGRSLPPGWVGETV